MSIEVKVNRLYKLNDEEKAMKAFVDIEVNESLIVKGLRVMNGKNGLFVSMPRQKGRDNKWYETVKVLTPETKEKINEIVLAAYGSKEKSYGCAI